MKDLLDQATKLCWEIEKLPCSEQQTEISIKASALTTTIEKQSQAITALLDECSGIIKILYRHSDPEVVKIVNETLNKIQKQKEL